MLFSDIYCKTTKSMDYSIRWNGLLVPFVLWHNMKVIVWDVNGSVNVKIAIIISLYGNNIESKYVRLGVHIW
jgi:hypothetical protein